MEKKTLEIDEECLVTVVLFEVKERIKIIQATRTQLLKWYGLELFLQITDKDPKDLPGEIRLNVVVERELPTCYVLR